MFTTLEYLFPNFSTVVEIKQLHILLRRVRLSHHGPAFLLDAFPPIIIPLLCSVPLWWVHGEKKNPFSSVFRNIAFIKSFRDSKCSLASPSWCLFTKCKSLAFKKLGSASGLYSNAHLWECLSYFMFYSQHSELTSERQSAETKI